MAADFDPTRLGDVTRAAMGRREREARTDFAYRQWIEYGKRGDLDADLARIAAYPDPVPTDFDNLDEMLARGALRPRGRRLHAALLARFRADPKADLSDEDIRQARLAFNRACAPLNEWSQEERVTLREINDRFDATYPLPAGFVLREKEG